MNAMSLGLGSIANEPRAISASRQAALKRFQNLGFPNQTDEAWKYTNVGPIKEFDYTKSKLAANPLAIEPYISHPQARLTFVNGRLSGSASHECQEPKTLWALSFEKAFKQTALDNVIERYLGKSTLQAENAFSALNQSAFEDGAVIWVPADGQAESVVEVNFQSQTDLPASQTTNPRLLIVVGRHSRLRMVEHYAGVGTGKQFVNSLVEVFLEEGAELELITVQRGTDHTFQVASTYVNQARHSKFVSQVFGFGAGTVRHEIAVRLAGEGANCHLNGLNLGRDQQHFDSYTLIDHTVPHCQSRELYKCILDGNSTGVFFGRVRVEKDAQKTDSVQTNKNLLLSETATMNSRPQLEIFADDVKCNHGAAVGQLDENALFYLRSRGIDPPAAKQMLTYAFAAEMINLVAEDEIRQRLAKELHQLLDFSQT